MPVVAFGGGGVTWRLPLQFLNFLPYYMHYLFTKDVVRSVQFSQTIVKKVQIRHIKYRLINTGFVEWLI